MKAVAPQLVAALAMQSVEAAASLPKLNGKQRHRAARKDLARKLDALLTFPPTPMGLVAELVDGPLLLLCGSFVEHAYQQWRTKRAKRTDSRR